jgi:putative tricarboxylic transport membrane protein
VGYALRYFAVPFLPMVLGVVLGFMIESNYRRALVLSNGDLSTFVRNPISAALLATAIVVLAGSLMRHSKTRAAAR